MKRCTKCGTTDQSKFAKSKNANYSTYCLKCAELTRQSGGQAQQTQNNKLILKGLKP